MRQGGFGLSNKIQVVSCWAWSAVCLVKLSAYHKPYCRVPAVGRSCERVRRACSLALSGKLVVRIGA